MKKPLVLMILDGFGIAPKEGNAIVAASTPNLDRILKENPVTKIGASGLDVGLHHKVRRGGGYGEEPRPP